MTHIIKGQALCNESMSPEKISHKIRKNHQVLNILIADDNILCRNAIVRQLESLKYVITQCENGMEAVEQYKKAADSYDLIMIDNFMPILDGMGSIGMIREYEKNEKLISTPIISIF